MAYPTFFGAGAGFATQTEGALLTPALPASTLAGDIAFSIYCQNAESGTPIPPSGWTSVYSFADPLIAYYLRYKRLTGGDANPDWDDDAGGTNLSSTNGAFARTYVFRGCISSGQPYEGANNNNGATVTPNSAACTTTGAERLIVNFLFVDDDTAWLSGHPHASWSEPVADYAVTTGGDGRLCVQTIQRASAGTEPSVAMGTISGAGAESWISVTLALLPEVATAKGPSMSVVNQAVKMGSM